MRAEWRDRQLIEPTRAASSRGAPSTTESDSRGIPGALAGRGHRADATRARYRAERCWPACGVVRLGDRVGTLGARRRTTSETRDSSAPPADDSFRPAP